MIKLFKSKQIAFWTLILCALTTKGQTNSNLPSSYNQFLAKAFSFYPELKNSNIRYKYDKYRSPLSASFHLSNIIKKPTKRKYTIRISNELKQVLQPAMFQNLSDSAKIGVLCHELAHILYFSKLNLKEYFHFILGQLTRQGINESEWETDYRVITQGAGLYLRAWSMDIRCKLDICEWYGADQLNKEHKFRIDDRYMNPSTIDQLMKLLNN